MIKQPSQIKFLIPTSIRHFDTQAEPTIEGASYTDIFGDSNATGSQIIEAMDGHSKRRAIIQANVNFRIDLETEFRSKYDFLMIDEHSFRGAFADNVRAIAEAKYNSADNYGAATAVSVNRTLTGIIGKDRPSLGMYDDNVVIADSADADIAANDFAIEFDVSPGNLDLASEFILDKRSGDVGYGLELQDNDLYLRIGTTGTPETVLIASGIASTGDDLYCLVAVNRATSGVEVYRRLNEGPIELFSTATIALAAGPSLANASDLYFGDDSNSQVAPFTGRIRMVRIWDRLPTGMVEIDAASRGCLPSTGIQAAWDHDGINQGESKWYANIGTTIDGTISANTVYHNTPGENNIVDGGLPQNNYQGFSLLEFDSAHAKFWFTDINPGTLTGAPDIGQVVFGETFRFNGLEVDGGYSGEILNEGISVGKTLNGLFQTEKLYDATPTHKLNIQLSTREQFNRLQEMISILEGQLFPFYVIIDDKGVNPVVRRVRMASNSVPDSFRHALSQPWKASLDLVDDLG